MSLIKKKRGGGMSALGTAIATYQFSMAKLLIENGADINKIDGTK